MNQSAVPHSSSRISFLQVTASTSAYFLIEMHLHPGNILITQTDTSMTSTTAITTAAKSIYHMLSARHMPEY